MLQYKFVELMPEPLEEGVLYISMEYCTAIHKCVCGCGNKVVTPLSPTDWKMTFDETSISLSPSIGNWSFPCQSHYWIVNNMIIYASKWNSDRIQEGRVKDNIQKEFFYAKDKSPVKSDVPIKPGYKSWSIWTLINFLKIKLSRKGGIESE